MTTLPVREMVLYKHGVGFFVREGSVSGQEAALTFRQEEINDVLKSLAVFDKSGGQVLGIHYQTPMDQAARLASSSIRLSENASLRDLIGDLRGRQAALSFETTPGTLEAVNGRVIGIDEPNRFLDVKENFGGLSRLSLASDSLAEMLVTVLADDGQVRVYKLGALRAFRIQDSQSEHDLAYFLDSSMSEDTRRTVNVRLSEGDHEIVVYYVAPSPTWRVSYRLVAESDEGGEKGKALLQGWGLFDNRLEEDLENVRVTLVAGQPISFIYDLYASRIPVRPTVKDEARVAPGPVEFAGGAAEDLEWLAGDVVPEHVAKAAAPRARMMAMAAPAAPPAAAPMSREKMAQSAPPAAEAKEAGEFFQYVVTAPVSVKRGESALVPIIGSDISYQRELLYNGSKLPTHPVMALRFVNSTGLTLERGPVTVVEDGDYKGEAVVTFTKDGNQVYLPYAVELGVKVTERPKNWTETTGLKIKDAYFVYEDYSINENTYILENTTAKALTVTIETSLNLFAELFDTRAPDVENANEKRWRVAVPARGKSEFVRKTRQRNTRREEVRKLDYQKLSQFMKNRWLDDATMAQLSGMLDTLKGIQQARAKQGELDVERKKLYEQQEQLRANLGALQATGQEAALRNRMLGQLESTQNRLEAIEQEINDLTRQAAEAEQQVNALIVALG